MLITVWQVYNWILWQSYKSLYKIVKLECPLWKSSDFSFWMSVWGCRIWNLPLMVRWVEFFIVDLWAGQFMIILKMQICPGHVNYFSLNASGNQTPFLHEVCRSKRLFQYLSTNNVIPFTAPHWERHLYLQVYCLFLASFNAPHWYPIHGMRR